MSTPKMWWSLLFTGLGLAYAILLLSYLHSTKDYSQQMSKKSQDFRAVAVVITWIQIFIMGLSFLGILFNILSGQPGRREAMMSFY